MVSPDSWVTEEQFLAGLGLAQSIPGPLFNFAAYLGAVVRLKSSQINSVPLYDVAHTFS